MVISNILKTFKQTFFKTQKTLTKMFLLQEISICTYWIIASTIIYHILTNSFVKSNFKTIIFKTDVSDHFPNCSLQPPSTPNYENKATYITKTVITNNATEMFKQESYKIYWGDVINNNNLNDAYNFFYTSLLFYMISTFQNNI